MYVRWVLSTVGPLLEGLARYRPAGFMIIIMTLVMVFIMIMIIIMIIYVGQKIHENMTMTEHIFVKE